MSEAEQTVRAQMKNRKGTDVFVTSTRIATFNKLFGMSTAAAYRQPDQHISAEELKPLNSNQTRPNKGMFSG